MRLVIDFRGRGFRVESVSLDDVKNSPQGLQAGLGRGTRLRAQEQAARNKGSQEAKAAEAAAKNLVLLMQRASQLVGRISGDVERDPDNYVWACWF